MNPVAPHPSAPPPIAASRTGAATVPPLLPVVLTLVTAAIAISIVFAWIFPATGPIRPVAPARFTNITAEAGIHFVHHQGLQDSPTTLGGAVAVIDYDRDGHPDLFFVNGTAWPWEDMGAWTHVSACALYHNDGTGHFTDVSRAAGLDVVVQGMGVAVGDYDNDGFPDIFVTCIGANHLFHNRGDGTFEDVTLAAGVGGDDHTWSMGATWIDCDGDGKLDLVVAHYASWPQEVSLAMAFTIADVGRSYGAPTGFIGVPPSVYHNLGHGKFALVPGAAGLRNLDPQTGLPVAKALAVVPVDANGHGKLDLLFSYHTSESALFLNQGDGTFKRWTAGQNDRHEGASAVLALASLLPLQASDAGERLEALQSAGVTDGRNRDEPQLHLRDKLAGALFDYELDGQLAVFSGNGRAEPDVNKFETGRAFQAAPQLLLHRGSRWVPAPVAAGESGGWASPVVARGIAVADFDGDGDDDIVMVQNNGPAQLLRNDQRRGLPWLQIDLEATRGPREAGGAQVEVHTPRRVLMQTMAPAMGFMAQSSSTLVFGLGEDARVRKIVVRWPSGVRQEIRPAGINRRIVLTEP
jgi:hypothetical protein